MNNPGQLTCFFSVYTHMFFMCLYILGTANERKDALCFYETDLAHML